jgi:hypothetical protein
VKLLYYFADEYREISQKIAQNLLIKFINAEENICRENPTVIIKCAATFGKNIVKVQGLLEQINNAKHFYLFYVRFL